MEKIIAKRIRNILEPQLEEEQYGFRGNRTTTDLIFAVRMIMEKYWEKGRDIIFVFLDIEKAYDSLPREKIWECLSNRNIPQTLIRKVKMLYNYCQNCVQIGDGYSDWFATTKGVQQGSALSPLLFISVMDEVIKKVKQNPGNDFKAFAFADDVVVWGCTEDEVQQNLNAWNHQFKEFGLQISRTKTVAMVVSRQRLHTNIELDGVKLEQVEYFQYLGSIMTEDNRCSAEVTNRIKKGAQFYHQVRNLLWDQQIPLTSKKVMYQAYFLPIMTYGLETCTINRRDSSRLQATEMKFLRTMLQKTRRDKVRNVKIRSEIQVKPLNETIATSRLKWFGHVKRMNPSRKARVWLEQDVEGKRPRGRPRTRWISQIKEDLQGRGVNWHQVEEEEMYLNRQIWRALLCRTRETGDG